MSAKKCSDEKVRVLPDEDLLWEQGKEVLRLGMVYGLLDGTICTSREEALATNRDLVAEYADIH